MVTIRQPIVTVAGHVDHGKTSILDRIRGTSVQAGEAGGITQKISFTTLPYDTVVERAGVILEKFKIPLEIPGFLFIDTPGHAAFTNLRKRGGSLADVAVLVIDINEGIKPQTAEVLHLLKANKTPFIIALNKIDNISGWKKSDSLFSYDSVEHQGLLVKQNYEEKFYTLIGALNSYGINAEAYYKISDFTKNVAVVPCSAKSGEGIAEILAMLAALSQKFLKDKIRTRDEGKGVVLEVKKEKTGTYVECILYDGSLSSSDELVIGSFGEPVVTKIRSMQEARPLNKGFETKTEVLAACGLRLQVSTKEDILSGMPFAVVSDNIEQLKDEFRRELSEDIQLDSSGIVIKADSLGSLEALLTLLQQKGIGVVKADIGPITKKDVYIASSLPEDQRIILGFNVDKSDEISYEESKAVKILTNQVVYKLIEDVEEWKANMTKELERQKLESLPKLCKITMLDFVFRNSNPAVFGVRVDAGRLVKGERFINASDEKIGQIKEMQEEKNNVQEAVTGKELAISMPGVNVERQLRVGESLYTNLSETDFRKFKDNKDLLSKDEKSVLQEIAQIKRRLQPTWGI